MRRYTHVCLFPSCAASCNSQRTVDSWLFWFGEKHLMASMNWHTEPGLMVEQATISVSCNSAYDSSNTDDGFISASDSACQTKPEDCLLVGSVVINRCDRVEYVGTHTPAPNTELDITNCKSFSRLSIRSPALSLTVDIVPPAPVRGDQADSSSSFPSYCQEAMRFSVFLLLVIHKQSVSQIFSLPLPINI